uniref:Putative ovule protein n=1 Tax=Solanum chacoense TaxID=4108 RepID=A0A0V0HCD8_SOLCH
MMHINCTLVFVYFLSGDILIFSQSFAYHNIVPTSALHIIIMSSAKAMWFIFKLPLGIPNLLNSFFSISLLRDLDITSAASINKVGDKGSPCFKPLEDLKNPFGWPFKRIVYQLSLISLYTISIILSPNPILLSTFVRNNHSNLSYAFIISNFMIRLGGLPLFLISATISCTNNIFSAMLRPCTKPACSCEIIFGRKTLILS